MVHLKSVLQKVIERMEAKPAINRRNERVFETYR